MPLSEGMIQQKAIIMKNLATITPKQLANIIKKDPKTFIKAFNEAEKKYKEQQIDEQFEKPVQIETDGRVTFGDLNAPVTIVEFSDFQCPPCAMASRYVKTVIKKYEGKVRLVFRHFPLSFHKMAEPAAIYFEAIAMEDQEKARKFHDNIYENIEEYIFLKDEDIIKNKLQDLVKKVDADLKKVTKNKKEAEKIVQKDLSEASHLNITGTPTFFINGVRPPAKKEGFEAVIERHLKKL